MPVSNALEQLENLVKKRESSLALNRAAQLASLMALVTSACGTMKVTEVHYFRVSDGPHVNYYRLNVEAVTGLSDTEYRSGWYPARSVDSLFGDPSSESGIEAIKIRAALEDQVNTAVKDTTSAWLQEAGKPDADETKLQGLLRARRRVMEAPDPGMIPTKNAVEISYNPTSGLVSRHGDEKLVFVLSANPDEVISKITNFSESDQTSLTINNLAGVLAARAQGEISALQAKEVILKLQDQMVSKQLQETLTAVASSTTDDRANMLSQIRTVRFLLKDVNE